MLLAMQTGNIGCLGICIYEKIRASPTEPIWKIIEHVLALSNLKSSEESTRWFWEEYGLMARELAIHNPIDSHRIECTVNPDASHSLLFAIPPEILSSILRRLSFDDLQKVTLVSKHFRTCLSSLKDYARVYEDIRVANFGSRALDMSCEADLYISTQIVSSAIARSEHFGEFACRFLKKDICQIVSGVTRTSSLFHRFKSSGLSFDRIFSELINDLLQEDQVPEEAIVRLFELMMDPELSINTSYLPMHPRIFLLGNVFSLVGTWLPFCDKMNMCANNAIALAFGVCGTDKLEAEWREYLIDLSIELQVDLQQHNLMHTLAKHISEMPTFRSQIIGSSYIPDFPPVDFLQELSKFCQISVLRVCGIRICTTASLLIEFFSGNSPFLSNDFLFEALKLNVCNRFTFHWTVNWIKTIGDHEIGDFRRVELMISIFEWILTNEVDEESLFFIKSYLMNAMKSFPSRQFFSSSQLFTKLGSDLQSQN